MGRGFIIPNPSFENQNKLGLLGFLGVIGSWLHAAEELSQNPLQPDPPLLCLTLTVASHNIFKSWRMLKESFLSSICPGLLVGSSDFLSRTDRELTLSHTPKKLQSMLQTPIISPNTQKIISFLFLSLAPPCPFFTCANADCQQFKTLQQFDRKEFREQQEHSEIYEI